MNLDAQPGSASSVKAMQQKSRILIFADPVAVTASCRNLCNPRRFISKLPLIDASVYRLQPYQIRTPIPV
ncbi:unnamed protein product [Linum trigynum]|uniref:Uncharacterized protein n=1 Tax=Linum trigynum TaxID=586398 RepID=A0AAV2DMG3_9ROSI